MRKIFWVKLITTGLNMEGGGRSELVHEESI